MMKEIYLLSYEERELYFNIAADKLNLPFEIIEKDYWVVWCLEKLFALNPYLTFKGGTSLSKIYGVIERFSEDIDLSIEKDFLGFGATNSPENAPSKKKQHAILDNLANACCTYVQTELLTALRDALRSKLRNADSWSLFVDEEDPDGQTLLFEYPNNSSKLNYIRPQVKIELGARSEHFPISRHRIQSYAKEALPDKVYEPEIWIRVLDVERTFWEKATILHQYAHLPLDKKLPPRISRHYYDFFRLLSTELKEKALSKSDLLERVANHKSIYFASNWANYKTARIGSLRLSPPSHISNDLEKDYKQMEPMFFRECPKWQLIIDTIDRFEKEFNNQNAPIII